MEFIPYYSAYNLMGSRTPEPNQKGTVLGGPNWKIEGKWAENDKNQSIFEGQGGPGPPTSGVPEDNKILVETRMWM